MFKDYGKYLKTSLKVYLFVLVIVFIMKLAGVDYFWLDLNNSFMINLDNFLKETKLIYIIDFVTLYIMFYIYISIVCNNKKVKLFTLFATMFEFIMQLILLKFNKVNELKYIAMVG